MIPARVVAAALFIVALVVATPCPSAALISSQSALVAPEDLREWEGGRGVGGFAPVDLTWFAGSFI